MRKRDPATLEKILIAASEAFAETGFHGVKISRLCEQAGVANGTFYLYFRNKRAIYEAVLRRALAEFMAALRANEGLKAPPALIDLRDVEVIVDYSLKRPAFTRTVFEERKLRLDDDTTIRRRLLTQRMTAMERGKSAGIFRADLDPRLGALAEIAVTAELIGTWLEDPGGLTRDQLVEQLWQFRLRLAYAPEHWLALEDLQEARLAG